MQVSELTLNHITYEWLAKETNPKMLKRALKLLKDDGNYFPDLAKAIDDKLQQVDEKYRRQKLNENISQEDIEKSRQKLFEFEDELKNADKLLLEAKGQTVVSSETIQLKRKKEAENEKFKGNEMMKTKEYDEAIRYYTRSLAIDDTEPTTYCNRALAYIRNKMFNKGLQDCDTAIKLKKNYIKAYYRRHICLAFNKKFWEALSDLLIVVSDNPNSQTIQGDIKKLKEDWKKYDEEEWKKIESKVDSKIEDAMKGKYNINEIQKNKEEEEIKIKVVGGEDKKNFVKINIVEEETKPNEEEKKEETKIEEEKKEENIPPKKEEEKKEEKSTFKKIAIQEDDDE